MGIIRDAVTFFTGIPLPQGKRPSNDLSSAGDQDDDKTGSDYGETYGQHTLRRVKRATKRIGSDKGNDR